MTFGSSAKRHRNYLFVVERLTNRLNLREKHRHVGIECERVAGLAGTRSLHARLGGKRLHFYRLASVSLYGTIATI